MTPSFSATTHRIRYCLYLNVFILSVTLIFFYIIKTKIKLFYYNKIKQNKYTIIEYFLVLNSVFTTIIYESIQLPTNDNLHSVLPLEIMQYLMFLFFYAIRIQKLTINIAIIVYNKKNTQKCIQ